MFLDVLGTLLQQTPSPTPTTGIHSDGGGWSWFVVFFVPVVLPVVVAGLLSSVLWIRNEGAWEITPWNAVGIPAVAIVAQLVPFVYFRGLSSVQNSPPRFHLALAGVTGVAVVSGAAVKQRHLLYIFASTVIGVGALAVIIVDSGLRIALYFALGSALVGFVIGYLTGKPDESTTEPTVIEAGPS